jgi:predicted GH43/DUF377 family glycosyl hydrolase
VIHVNKLGILLEKTEHNFENEGVLNPALIQVDGKIHLFYRAVAKDNYSTIGYCTLSEPFTVESRQETPILFPQSEYEFQGLEDPRITEIDGVYYLSYTAYNGINSLGALATSTDLIHWQKHGIVVPQVTYDEFKHFIGIDGSKLSEKYIRFNESQQGNDKRERKVFLWDKNLTFFPRRIKGKICFLHRIKPDIQVVLSLESLEDLTVDFWQNYFLTFSDYVVLEPKYNHEVSYIGGGCPPIETEAGWLVIYHGVHDTVHGYVYTACAALLDLDNPAKEIARLPYPLFSPDQSWEMEGYVNNVCFPTGTITRDDTLYIYYGAADERIAVASLVLSDLITELLNHKK